MGRGSEAISCWFETWDALDFDLFVLDMKDDVSASCREIYYLQSALYFIMFFSFILSALKIMSDLRKWAEITSHPIEDDVMNWTQTDLIVLACIHS